MLVFSTVLFLTGCAAVGVFPTSNPEKKLGNAYAMIKQGRYLRAKQFSEEALEIYKKNDDKLGMARSHSILGDILRVL